MIATRSHAAATTAFERVKAMADCESVRGAYRTLVLAFPAMCLQNGLSQATGFLLAKGKAEHKALLDDLAAVMRAAGVVDATSGESLHERIIQGDLADTMRHTRHALEASAWLKRYAQGLLPKSQEEAS